MPSGKPTFVDLFSGAGGLSLGFKRAGWTSLLAVDVWAEAIRTYEHNFAPEWLRAHGEARLVARGRKAMVADLFDPEAKERIIEALGAKRPDWVIGGPPCKGFSTVGKRDRSDPRNRLVEEFADVVELLDPSGFLIENVLGLRDMKFVAEVVKRFQDLGYTVVPAILKAAEYGVPQLRRRIIFVGSKGGKAFKKPIPVCEPEEYTTCWAAIGDLPSLLPGESAETYARDPESEYQRNLRGSCSQLHGHTASKHPPSLVRAISFIPDGGNRKSIPKRYQPKSGFHNSYSRLSSTAPAVAVTQNMGKPSGTRCIHPFQDRGLTAREGARLQTFPDWFQFQGGIVSQREQIANAVPPILAEAIARRLDSSESWANDTSEAVVWNAMELDGTLRNRGANSDDSQLSLFD